MSPDVALFRLINGLAGHNALADAVARLVVNEYFVPSTFALVLLALWFAPPASRVRQRYQFAVLQTALGLFLANLIVKGMNLIYFRPRPFAVMEVTRCFYRPTDSSFPSNPATVGFAMATGVYLYDRRVGLGMYVLATAFALARVYCGVHYPLDIVAGALIGSLSAVAVVRGMGFLTPLWRGVIRIARWLYLG